MPPRSMGPNSSLSVVQITLLHTQ